MTLTINRAAAIAAGLALVLFKCAAVANAQALALDSDESVYRAACAACHGPDGRGTPQLTVGFDVPLPDFTDCNYNSREVAADWFAIAHAGGPVRSFNTRMPSFGQALTAPQIEMAVAHIKRFCSDRAWPAGELNLPRALVTEKAFPEDEAVVSTSMASGTFVNDFLYEHRLGARTQYEVKVPFAVQDGSTGWRRGLGDVAVAVKHAFHHSLEAGRIVAAAAEITLPTAKENEGLGGGRTIFEPFIAFGQILPSDGFLQVQSGFEIPVARNQTNEFFWRGAAGKSFVQGQFGRTWSPMVEVLGAKELAGGEEALWDVVPQMQVSLSKRQHIMISAGVRMPVNERSSRSTQVLTYFLWDWFDGGLFNGWR